MIHQRLKLKNIIHKVVFIFQFLILNQLIQMIPEVETSSIGAQFISLQKLFSSFFSTDVITNNDVSDFIDLTHFMQDTLITLPTLNG